MLYAVLPSTQRAGNLPPSPLHQRQTTTLQPPLTLGSVAMSCSRPNSSLVLQHGKRTADTKGWAQTRQQHSRGKEGQQSGLLSIISQPIDPTAASFSCPHWGLPNPPAGVGGRHQQRVTSHHPHLTLPTLTPSSHPPFPPQHTNRVHIPPARVRG